ncbi:carbon monoxide dehydrogenase subunit G (CoxG) [mine drainage metagenome]|uniref:Carbon monoxide dehydrogenase subunit G (CoxG) n=1 Tax=mine drainage metagenome TaxID=410659 RepID=A0A1J5SE86_9ZZZZ
MQVKLEKQYTIATSPEAAWLVLRDVRVLASCMPGAEITEQVDSTHYKGHVKVKVGPAVAAFGGEIEILAFDEVIKSVRMMGKGADKGGSSASMDLTASIRPSSTAGQCLLLGSSDVIVNGKFAQFGGRMMTSVSDMILGQFADNFAVKASEFYAQTNPDLAHAAGANTAPKKSKAQTELNAFSILWGLIKGFFSGLVGSKK